MAIVSDLHSVRDWIQQKICDPVKLKIPAERDNQSYEYQLVTPSAFILYLPTKDRMPPNMAAPIPSVCVEMLDGEDSLSAHMGTINLRLCFSAWNPGTHGADIFDPVKEKPGYYVRRYNEQSREFYQRNTEGWEDVWNFIDFAIQKIESSELIGGLPIDREVGIKFGVFSQDGALIDSYPYWHGWITFTLKRTYAAKKAFEQYL